MARTNYPTSTTYKLLKRSAGLALSATFVLGAIAGTAHAQWRDHGRDGGYYRAPPVVYGGYYRAPPVVYGGYYGGGYGYAAPPVVYGPGVGVYLPGVVIGVQ